MLQNEYFLAKIGADTAENEQHFAEILPRTGNHPTGPRNEEPRRELPGPPRRWRCARPLLGWKHPRADSLNLPTYSSLADVVVEFREEIVLLLQYNSYLPTDVRRIVGSL